ncbi:MAG: hypothetical protein WC675_03145 [Patescibacteria group bacterium]|jgi:hypothetical protein
MKEKITKVILISLGIFFIAFGTFAMDFGIYRGKPGWLLWLCYWGMVIIGFGILTKNGYLILSQINILTIPLLFWNIDFTHYLATGKDLWGITDYFFGEMLKTARFISFEHLFLLPLTLLALYLIKINKKGAWKLSLAQLALFFVLSRLFTNPEHNVNCVFVSCYPFFPTDSWHPLRWFLVYGAMILFTYWIISVMPLFKKKIAKKNQ